MKTIISFPPWSGGNHVKNMLKVQNDNFDFFTRLYSKTKHKEIKQGENTVHETKGPNLSIEIFNNDDIVCGHFGQVMSIRNDIANTKHKKWILISPDTRECREIIANRFGELTLDGYYDQEQLFLYESHMYHNYFKSSMNDIMNISVYELWENDIDKLLDRLDFFLPFDINKDKAKHLHKLWRAKFK